MLFDRLCIPFDVAAANISLLRESGLPIVFFGAGSAARGWVKYLDDHGVPPSAVCVGDAYWRENMEFEGRRVERFSEVLRRNPKMNVVLGCVNRVAELKEELYCTGRVEWVVAFGPSRPESMFAWRQLNAHRMELEKLYARLGDDRSRDVLVALINSRLMGDKGILDVTNIPGEDQYFPPFVPCSPDAVFVDCGAYTGDTFDVFRRHYANGYEKYVAFECDPKNFRILKAMHSDPRLVCIQKGVSDRPGSFRMAADGSTSSKLQSDGEIEVELTTLDMTPECQDATIVKMDIEGAECAALRGGGGLIRRNRPILEICIYYKASDIYEIPAIIVSLDEGYVFYLRYYPSVLTHEVVLYALPK